MAFETAVQSPQRRVVQFLFPYRDHQQIGLDTVNLGVAKADFHRSLGQSLRRIKFMNSLRVSTRLRNAPSKLLVMT